MRWVSVESGIPNLDRAMIRDYFFIMTTNTKKLTEMDVAHGYAELCRGCGHIQEGQGGQCLACGECDTVTAGEMVSDQEIRALRDSAGQAGDREQVALCDAALDGYAEARDACAAALVMARAMEGT